MLSYKPTSVWVAFLQLLTLPPLIRQSPLVFLDFIISLSTWPDLTSFILPLWLQAQRSVLASTLWIVEAAHLTAPEAAKNVASQALPTPPLSHSNSS